MRSKTNRIIIATSLFLCAFQASADRVGLVGGDGQATCGGYLEDRRTAAKDALYGDWVIGFISSYNLFGSKSQVTQIPSQSTVVAYLDKYCRDNPLSNVSAGTIQLTKDLGGMK